jgi:hypothetical protein
MVRDPGPALTPGASTAACKASAVHLEVKAQHVAEKISDLRREGLGLCRQRGQREGGGAAVAPTQEKSCTTEKSHQCHHLSTRV